MSPIMILALVVVVIAIFVMTTYNSFIKLKNRAEEAWSDIDVQLKRRYNLIPNIVESVKAYAAHEEGVFTKVTEARSNAINATNMQDQAAAENMLSGALKSLFAVAENYPTLKANENFIQLQNELVDTEDKIQSARRFYNGVVKDFNTKVQQFPANVIAGMFKFEEREFFEIENEEEKEVVKVDFSKPAETPTPAPAAPVAPVETPAEPVVEEVAPVEPTLEPEAPAVEEIKEEVVEAPVEESAPETPVVEETPEPVAEPVAEETAPVEEVKEEVAEAPVVEETPAPVEEVAPAEPVVEEAPVETPVEEPKMEEAPIVEEEEKPAEPEAPAMNLVEPTAEAEAPAEEPAPEAPAEEEKKDDSQPIA